MTKEESLNAVKAGIESIVAGASGLRGVEATPDPWAEVGDTPALDALERPGALLEPEKLAAILLALDRAKTSDERLAEVLGWLARLGMVFGGLV